MTCIRLFFLTELSHLLHYSISDDMKLILDYTEEMLISALKLIFSHYKRVYDLSDERHPHRVTSFFPFT